MNIDNLITENWYCRPVRFDAQIRMIFLQALTVV